MYMYSNLGGEGGSLCEVVGEGGGEHVAIETVITSQGPHEVGVDIAHSSTL